jgi:hypothetical protein
MGMDDNFASATGKIKFISCQKPGMDTNYCLIVLIVYMSYSNTNVHRKLQNVVYMKKSRS